MADQVPLGDVVNGLGVTHQPDEGELISDAVVLLKVVHPNGSVGLRVRHSVGMSWIECIGMLRTAELLECADLRTSDPSD